MGLEAHQIVNALGRVVLPQLQNRVGLRSGFGVRQAHGLHGTVAQGVRSPAGHDLHRHTAFKHPLVLKPVNLRLLRGDQFLYKSLVLLLVHGTVYIIRSAPIISALPPGKLHIHGFRRHQRSGRIEEMQVFGTEVFPDGFGKGIRGQRACGNDHRPLRHLGHLLVDYGNQGVAADSLRHQPGKALSVHGQAAACLHPGGFRAVQNQAAAAAQLLF